MKHYFVIEDVHNDGIALTQVNFNDNITHTNACARIIAHYDKKTEFDWDRDSITIINGDEIEVISL